MEQLAACLVRYSEVHRVLKWLRQRNYLGEMSAREVGEIAYEYAVDLEHPHVVQKFNILAESKVNSLKAALEAYERPLSPSRAAGPMSLDASDYRSARVHCIELAEVTEALQLRRNRSDKTAGAHQRSLEQFQTLTAEPKRKEATPKTQAPLAAACRALAVQILSNSSENNLLEASSESFYEEAMFYADYIVGQSRDLNILTRAVDYLRETHAIPPFGTDIQWFKFSLSCLIELAVPNTGLSNNGKEFLVDLHEGMRVSYSS